MVFLRPILAGLLWSATISGALAQTQMELFELRHRPADDLLPLVRPLLSEDGSASGRDFTLIVRDDPDTLRTLQELITTFDTPPRQLLITVEQAIDGQAEAQGGALNRSGLHVYDRETRSHKQAGQHLRTLEGGWARIQSGKSLPLSHQTVVTTGQGVYSQQRVEYQDVVSGFEVRPLVRGEMVTLNVRPYLAGRSKTGAGTIDRQEMATQVQGRLGEWLEVGGTQEQSQDSGRGLFHLEQSRQNQQGQVRLKVEVVQ